MLRSLTVFLTLLTALLGVPLSAVAQQPPLPSQIRLVVPFAPGGGTDIFARKLAQLLSPKLGVSMVVENRPGAGSLIGSQLVAKSPADGSVLLFTSNSVLGAAAMERANKFDPTTELVPIALVSDGPMVVAVSTASGFKTPADLANAARANPGKVIAGNAGVGTIGHLASVALADAAKVELNHVPYQGTTPAINDMVGGRADLVIGSYSSMVAGLGTGRVAVIAVTTEKPSPAYPNLPTMASAAPGYEMSIWYGVFAPAGLPPALAATFNRHFREAASSPDMKDLLSADGSVVVQATPEQLQPRIKADFAQFQRLAAKVVK